MISKVAFRADVFLIWIIFSSNSLFFYFCNFQKAALIWSSFFIYCRLNLNMIFEAMIFFAVSIFSFVRLLVLIAYSLVVVWSQTRNRFLLYFWHHFNQISIGHYVHIIGLCEKVRFMFLYQFDIFFLVILSFFNTILFFEHIFLLVPWSLRRHKVLIFQKICPTFKNS